MKQNKLQLYIKRALVTSESSPDSETKVGSILISKSTGSVISEGYNGFVRGANDEALPKERPEKYKYVIHAEQNLIYNAARNGVRTDNCYIVQTHSPCVSCARALYQSGIDTVYYKTNYPGTDQIKNLGDLKLEYTEYEEFTKIVISPNKDLEKT
jgi:dCMP deaminase